jgi:GTP-binding protein Era
MLKKIGTAARKDIEKMLGEKIFLELKVTVRENWARQAKFMKELGYVHDSKN